MAQKTLREVLSARFISPQVKPKELVENLKVLSDHLSKLEQNFDTKQIDATAAALVQDYVLKHKDKDVKVLAACCLADIIRIYAPDAPYDDDQLRKIFKLFIDQLRGLEFAGQQTPASLTSASSSSSKAAAASGNGSSEPRALFGRYFYLLERLAVVKAFVLLVGLDDSLVTELFAVFFSIINPEHSAGTRTHLLDIMASCIDEAEAVPTPQLDVILGNLLPPAKTDSPAAYRLAQNLIFRCAARLQAPLAAVLGAAPPPPGAAPSELSENTHEIIFELARISPQLLLRVVPMMESELRTEEVEVRRKMVYLLSLIFTSSASFPARSGGGQQAAVAAPPAAMAGGGGGFDQAYRPLFQALLGRFNDRDADIRAKMVEFGRNYLLLHPPSTAGPAAAADLLAGLEARLRDGDEKIREAAVRAVGDVALRQPTHLSRELVVQLIGRLRDRKPAVRREALARLVAAYSMLLSQWGTDDWTPEQRSLYDPVPSHVVAAYLLPDIEDKFRVEMGFRTIIGGWQDGQPLPADQRAARLLHVVGLCDAGAGGSKAGSSRDPHAEAALIKLLKDKRSFQTDFAAILDLRKQKGADAADGVDARLKQLAERLPDGDREAERLRRLLALKDAAVGRALSDLADPDASDAALLDARKEINKRLGTAASSKQQKEAGPEVVLSGSFVDKLASDSLVSRDMSSHLLRLVSDRLTDDNIEEHRSSVLAQLRFFNEVAKVYPRHFAGLITQVTDLIVHSTKAVPDVAVLLLKLLASAAPCAQVGASQVAKVQKHLSAIGLQASETTQAKLAVRALLRMPGNVAVGAGALLEEAVAQLGGAGLPPKRIPGLLAAVAEAARLVPAEFAKRKAVVMQFVERLLMGSSDSGSAGSRKKSGKGKGVAADAAGAGQAEASVAAVRLVGRSVESIAKPGAEELEAVLLLVKVLAKRGDLQGGLGDAPLHADLRLAAARALLRLARLQPYEAKFTPEHFVRLASVVADPDVDVRTGVLHSLLKGLRSVRLPLRYLASIALCGTETDATLAQQAKAGLQACVKIRRELHQRRAGADDPEGLLQSALLPEYAVPHAVFLLAHQEPQFDEDKPKFERTTQQLSFLLDAVFSPASAPLLIELLSGIKKTQDAVWPQSRNIHIVSEIGLQWIKRQYDRKARRSAGEYPGVVVLPLQLFVLPPERTAARFRESTLLPADFQLPEAVKAPKAPSKKRKPTTEEVREEQSENDEDGDEEVPVTKKAKRGGRTKAAKRRARAQETDSEHSDMEEPQADEAPADEGVLDEEESEKPQTSTKKSSRAKEARRSEQEHSAELRKSPRRSAAKKD